MVHGLDCGPSSLLSQEGDETSRKLSWQWFKGYIPWQRTWAYNTPPPHTHGRRTLAQETKVSNLQCCYLISKNSGGITKKKRTHDTYWGVVLERNEVKLGGKNVLLPPATLRRHSFTESSLKNCRVTGVVLSSLQHPTAAFIARVSTAAFSVAGVNQLNMQGWSALGFSAQGAKLSVCNTGTK